MDLLYESEKAMCDMDDHDMSDILDNDIFQSPPTMSPDNYMDNEWLNSLFEDPVLNDKMITDAVQSPRIQSEHSYSLNNENDPISPLGFARIEDLDIDFSVNNQALDLSTKNGQMNIDIKQEPIDCDPILTCTSTSMTTTRTSSVAKQPTIILATPTPAKLKTECSVMPKITIKQEPAQHIEFNLDQAVNFDSIILPPTPPSSASSDSEGSQSPQQSAPSSPSRYSPTPSLQCHVTSPSSLSSKGGYSSPLFTNPIPQSGYLVLTEEEKRTLITEGFPIPNKLPLTKQEEKNLKKIRRKIKNKISAQESRRKKKEYLETLEKRVESFSQENNDLRKKVDSLENNNRSLLGQLQKLQSIVNKVRPVGSSQTGTVLMVLVLCFAVFLGGSWTPSSLNFGYTPTSSIEKGFFVSNPRAINPSPLMGPSAGNAYSTPSMKSRVLLSMRDDQEDVTSYEPYGPDIPKGTNKYYEVKEEPVEDSSEKLYNPRTVDLLVNVKDQSDSGRINGSGAADRPVQVVMVDKSIAMANGSAEDPAEYQASMHPDIMANAPSILSREPLRNTEIEKA
ncbi:hypothetical protein ScPMuIL_011982 [Solemya velum]